MKRWIAALAVLLVALACDQPTELDRLQTPGPSAADYVTPPILHEILTTYETGLYCRTSTFENAPHYLPINPEGGGLIPGGNIAFSPNWRTLTRGAYANNPSGVAIAVWLQAQSAGISFPIPVAKVGLWYSSYVPVTLEAFDADGALLASITGPANTSRGFVNWDPLELQVAGNVIARADVFGVANRTATDDVKNCTLVGKEACKNGGWEQFGFPNQGQCVRFVETGKVGR